MKTLWINVLGFSSGRTGLVVNDGQEPYKEGMVPNGEAAIVNRFQRRGCDAILRYAKRADRIQVLRYGSPTESNTVSLDQVVKALDRRGKTVGDSDGLVDLMPADDE